MEIFDFNFHLPIIKHRDVNVTIKEDLELNIKDIERGFEINKQFFDNCIGVNFMLFNPILFNTDQKVFFNSRKFPLKHVKYTALIDFRRKDIFDYVERLKYCGINAIMMNSYLQRILSKDFNTILKVIKYAEKIGLVICVDGSFGTSKMYKYDNMKLACAIADRLSSAKIVIIHSGGYRLIEAMLLAEDKYNVWLDTSFSLKYYAGSSIEMDYAYVLKKMNMERIIYGSDHPYVHFDDARLAHDTFFLKYDFKESQIEKVMSLNSIELFNEQ